MFAPNLRRATFASLVASLVLPALIQAQIPAEQLEAMRYRHIGPVGNRIASVSGVVGDPHVAVRGAGHVAFELAERLAGRDDARGRDCVRMPRREIRP